MFSFFKPKVAEKKVETEKVQETFKKLSYLSLTGIFLGYAAFYIVRNNLSLATPYFQDNLGFSETAVGLIISSMLVAYGISKGVMSAIADKASPKKFLATGLFLSAVTSILFGFTSVYWILILLAVFLGIFQGMGSGPSYITLANWFPLKSRGTFSAIYNVSHNVGGSLVSPIVAGSLAIFGASYWQLSSFIVPGIIAMVGVVCIVIFVKEKPEYEGLPKLNEVYPDENSLDNLVTEDESPEDMNVWDIFKKYVLHNKNAWLVSLADTFNYMIRYGILTWLPIYLLSVKGFTAGQMFVAFFLFEAAAIPSTLIAGFLSDKLFKGNRMLPAIIALIVIFGAIWGYWQSDSVLWVNIFASIAGCLIYVPMFLVSIQAVEVVPSFAAGSATGLRGITSYILGASLGVSLFGIFVENFGWDFGFVFLLMMVILGIVSCTLLHFGVKNLRQKAIQ